MIKDIKKLLKLLSGYKVNVFITLFSMAMVSIFTTLFSFIIQPLIDEVFLSGKTSVQKSTIINKLIFDYLKIPKEKIIIYLPILIIAIFFGKSLFTFISSYEMNYIGLNVVKKLRDKLYIHLLRQSVRFFTRSKTGELISKLTNDVDKLQNAITTTVSDVIRETFVFIGLLFVIFSQDPELSFLAFIVTPLALLPIYLFAKFAKTEGHKVQKLVGEISSSLYELVHGIRIIKIYNMEEFEKKRFLRLSDKNLKANIRLAIIRALSSPFMEFLGGVVAGVVIALGAKKISQGTLSPGQFSSFLAAVLFMYTPIRKITRANTAIQQGVASYERIESILSTKNEVEESKNKIVKDKIDGNIEYEDVYFKYDEGNGYVLKGINIKIDKGSKVALVGLSGSGKTTLVNLIPRFFDPSQGRVLIDGIDVKEYELISLRKNIGIVTQDVILFNDTVLRNITCGDESYSMDEVVESAKKAKAYDFIKELPEGFNTVVGERGQFLSSGERQRISIARIFLKNPPIIILDEATSSLDSESEKTIQEALENLMEGRTTIIIAHRLNTIRFVDRIYVLDKGEIVESGTHDELIKRGSLYAHLYSLQFPDRIEL